MKQILVLVCVLGMVGYVWGGPGCAYTLYMYDPTPGSDLTMNPTDTFVMDGCYTGNAYCPISSNVWAQFYNGTWNNITSSGNFSTEDSNPQTANMGMCWDEIPYWTVTANDGSNSKYAVRLYFDGLAASGNASINVTVPVVDACGTLTVNKTLNNNISSTGTCITIGANNVVLDCNKYKITYGSSGGTGSAVLYGIYNNGYNGTVIKNCNIESGSFSGADIYGDALGGKGVYFINAWNTTFLNVNSTVQGTVATTLDDFHFSTAYNLSMTNIRGKFGLSQEAWLGAKGLYLENVYNSTINTYFQTSVIGGNGNTGVYFGGTSKNITLTGLNIVLSETSSYGLYAPGTVHNLTFSSGLFNITDAGSYGIRFLAGNDIFMNNMTINAGGSAVTLEGTTGFLMGNSSLYSSTNQIAASSNTNNIIFRNVTMNKALVTTATSSNVTVQWYGRANVTNSAGAGLTATVNDTQNTTLSNSTFYGYHALTPWFIVNDTTFGSTANVIYNKHTIVTNLTGYTNNVTFFNFTGRDYTVNVTLYSSSTSSCTYAGSGNWIIQTADRCNITTSQYLGTNTLTFNGTTGYTKLGSSTIALIIITAKTFFFNISGFAEVDGRNGATWLNRTMQV